MKMHFQLEHIILCKTGEFIWLDVRVMMKSLKFNIKTKLLLLLILLYNSPYILSLFPIFLYRKTFRGILIKPLKLKTANHLQQISSMLLRVIH